MVELLLVLAIIAILSVVGVRMLGNRPGGAVREVMDELEGTLLAAQKLAVATGQDVLVETQGDWNASDPLILAYGSASLGSKTILNNGATAPEAFRLAVNASGVISREHMNAAVVTKAFSGWWDTATSGGNTSIVNVAPFNDATTGFQNMLTNNPNLFLGGANLGTARISGANKRFTTTFWIEVVGIRSGEPIAGGPMGLLVVQGNGASIYKFYNPGASSGGAWRRM